MKSKLIIIAIKLIGNLIFVSCKKLKISIIVKNTIMSWKLNKDLIIINTKFVLKINKILQNLFVSKNKIKIS